MAQFPNGTPYTGSASGIWNLKDMRNALMGGNWPLGVHAPGPPTSLVAYPGDSEVSVTFSAPADTGGYAITNYTVVSSPGSFSNTGSSSPILITGLTNGTSYTFTATATTSIDTSVASAASSAVSPVSGALIDYLVVAGGGGGGTAAGGGGGGAGGIIYTTGSSFTIGYSYTVTVGAGGASHTSGSNSVFDTFTAVGGGHGGNYNAGASGQAGGGSGGGGGGASGGTAAGTGGSATSGQGHVGGAGGFANT